MKNLLISALLFSVFISYATPTIGGVSCRLNNVTVEAVSMDDCETIGGKVVSSYLFVINFDTGSFDGEKLRLNGNGKSNVIFFSERPERKAGHMGVRKFNSIWTKGISSFKNNPPNATLSLILDGKDSDSVMTISNPSIDGDSIIFDVELIEGTPPDQFNTGGLFIDSSAFSIGALK